MAIPTRLYNKIFNIYRITNPTPSSDSFEISTAQIVISSRNVSGRLSSGSINEESREGSIKDAGLGSGYKNKLFFPNGTDVKTGDRIIDTVDTNNRFYVDYVNKFPGGLTDHHIECIVSASDFMVAS